MTLEELSSLFSKLLQEHDNTRGFAFETSMGLAASHDETKERVSKLEAEVLDLKSKVAALYMELP